MSNPVKRMDFTLAFKKFYPDDVEDEEIWIAKGCLEDMFARHADNYCFQLESAPTTGRLHFQGRVNWKVKRRMCQAMQVVEGHTIWWTQTSNNGSKTFDYLMKDDTRVCGPWYNMEDTEETKDGCTYVDHTKTTVALYEAPRMPDGAWSEHTEADAPQREFGVMLDNLFEQYMATEDAKLKDLTRRITILVDATGNSGKSRYVERRMRMGNSFVIQNATTATIVSQMAIRVYTGQVKRRWMALLDMPRVRDRNVPEIMAALENLGNGLAMDSRYKFTDRIFTPPLVVVFCNKLPAWDSFSPDRWNAFEIFSDGNAVGRIRPLPVTAPAPRVRKAPAPKLELSLENLRKLFGGAPL